MQRSTLWSLIFAGCCGLAAATSAEAAPIFRSLYATNGTSQGGGLFGSLLLDDAGNLYGTARDAGTPNYGFGTAFRLSPDGHGAYAAAVIHHFRERVDYGKPDGLNPKAGLIGNASGILYGTAFYGGEPSDMGVVYQLTPDGEGGYKESILHKFTNEDGRYPASRLTFDKAGNLYGTTYGVPYQCGTVFRLSRTQGGTWREDVLHDFGPSGGNGPDGCESTSGVVFDSAGNLYGATSGGGTKGYYGIVYELSPMPNDKWKETILHKFSLSEANLPYAGVTIGPSGELYGTTFGGGNQGCQPIGCGAVYELTRAQTGVWSEQLIYSFNGADGENPLGGVILDSAGNLYGTTDYGGQQVCNMGCGTVFKLSPSEGGQWVHTVLHAFNGSDGWGPGSDLIFDRSGNLFGTTISGGLSSSCCGTAFELTP